MTSAVTSPSTPQDTADPAEPSSTAAAGTPAAATVLTDALDALGTSYHFVTGVTVDGANVLTAEGDRVGSGVRLNLTNSAGTVMYVITDEGSWAKPENGTWTQLDVAPATTDPLEALAASTSVSFGSARDSGTALVVEVDNTVLGIPGGGSSTVQAMVVDGSVTQIDYASSLDGKAATVTTMFSDATSTDPVLAPV